MRLRRLVSLLGLAAVAFVPAAVPVKAQNAAMTGTFAYNASASDNVNTAIAQAVRRVNPVLRSFATRRLRSTNEPYRTIAIAQSGGQISITTDGGSTTQTPASGTPVAWRRPGDGDRLQVSTAWSGATLRQTFQAEDGTRVNAFTLSPDGRTLTMNASVSSPRLPGGLTYRLVYTKS